MEPKIAILSPTYNSWERIDQFLTSVHLYTKNLGNCEIIVLDDGTPDKDKVTYLEKSCQRFNARLIKHEKNEGIPKSWNDLIKATSDSVKYYALFNDDIRICDPNWLTCSLYFLKNNENISTIGFPSINVNPDTEEILNPEWEKSAGEKPGRVGSSVGCSFMGRKDVWSKVKNPDGSIGFWEGLVSFHEELHFNFRLAESGYYSYMLNHPPVEHHHSRTFALNPELTWTKFDSKFGDKEEYIKILKKSKVYPEDWKQRIISKEGRVDRMSYSRYLFAKYWDVLDNYDAPQVPVHNKILNLNSVEPRRIKWLDKNLNEKEDII